MNNIELTQETTAICETWLRNHNRTGNFTQMEYSAAINSIVTGAPVSKYEDVVKWYLTYTQTQVQFPNRAKYFSAWVTEDYWGVICRHLSQEKPNLGKVQSHEAPTPICTRFSVHKGNPGDLITDKVTFELEFVKVTYKITQYKEITGVGQDVESIEAGWIERKDHRQDISVNGIWSKPPTTAQEYFAGSIDFAFDCMISDVTEI